MPIYRWILLAAGTALAAFALLADRLGIGQPGFGERQVLLLVAGVALILAALTARRRRAGEPRSKPAFERLRHSYATAAVLLLNTLFLFAALNLALLIGFKASDAAGWTTPEQAGGLVDALALLRLARLVAGASASDEVSPLDLPDADLARIYPGWTRPDVARLLQETRGRRLGYAPFAQFAEQPYQGRFVRVSEHGFRHTRAQGPWPMDPAALNIWVLGGSTTFGYGLADDETIPSFLHAALAAAVPNRPVRVYNFGQAYYYSSQELAFFYRLLIASGVGPQAAVFIDGINEHFAEPFYSAALRELVRSPYTAPYVRPEPHALDDGDRIAERWLANRSLITAWCREWEIRPLFVWQPSPEWQYDKRFHLFDNAQGRGGPRFGASPHYAAMERRRDEAGEAFLWLGDLQVGVEKPLYVDRLHYSAAFARRIAERIAERLLTSIRSDYPSAP